MLPCDPSKADKTAPANNLGFITPWDKIKQRKDVQVYCRSHIDLCNVTKFLLLVVNLHIKLTKSRSTFYLMNATADSKTTFIFLVAKFLRNVSDLTPIFYRLTMKLSKMVLLRDIT